jgi:glutamine synthetase
MANEIRQFLRDHGISEVEAIIPDMAGIARGKIMPRRSSPKMRACACPEHLLQTVTVTIRPTRTRP